ncbi:hypothetical protein TYRP_005833 [Tyrophagus putrescentiae]|nr:hypothetical protein TYRP_005833 [Tyrophagus putrescentiae]
MVVLVASQLGIGRLVVVVQSAVVAVVLLKVARVGQRLIEDRLHLLDKVQAATVLIAGVEGRRVGKGRQQLGAVLLLVPLVMADGLEPVEEPEEEEAEEVEEDLLYSRLVSMIGLSLAVMPVTKFGCDCSRVTVMFVGRLKEAPAAAAAAPRSAQGVEEAPDRRNRSSSLKVIVVVVIVAKASAAAEFAAIIVSEKMAKDLCSAAGETLLAEDNCSAAAGAVLLSSRIAKAGVAEEEEVEDNGARFRMPLMFSLFSLHLPGSRSFSLLSFTRGTGGGGTATPSAGAKAEELLRLLILLVASGVRGTGGTGASMIRFSSLRMRSCSFDFEVEDGGGGFPGTVAAALRPPPLLARAAWPTRLTGASATPCRSTLAFSPHCLRVGDHLPHRAHLQVGQGGGQLRLRLRPLLKALLQGVHRLAGLTRHLVRVGEGDVELGELPEEALLAEDLEQLQLKRVLAEADVLEEDGEQLLAVLEAGLRPVLVLVLVGLLLVVENALLQRRLERLLALGVILLDPADVVDVDVQLLVVVGGARQFGFEFT